MYLRGRKIAEGTPLLGYPPKLSLPLLGYVI